MAKKTRPVRMYYSYAESPSGFRQTLADVLIDAYSRLSTRKKRSFIVDDYQLQGLYVTVKSGGILFTISKCSPDQPTGVVPKPNDEKIGDVAEEGAPGGGDFLEGENFLFVSGNHVLICSLGSSNEKTAQIYIRQILAKIDLATLGSSLNFQKKANVQKIRLLREEGAQSLTLGSMSVAKADLDYDLRKNSTARNGLKALVDEIKTIFQKSPPATDETVKALANLSVKFSISCSPTRKGGKLAEQVLEKLATEVAQDDHDDEFLIVTSQTKTKISYDEIRISSLADMQKHGNTVQRHDAFVHLQNYFNELQKEGKLVT